MDECIYDLGGLEDLPENPELVEFLCAEPDKPSSEVQDPFETIDLETKKDSRPIQISGLDPTLVEHRMPIKEGFKPVKNINGATPKDEYLMPMADLSVDAVAKQKVLSFMDGNAGYNHIKMAKEDIHKTTFRCPGHVRAYEYLVMPFELKNAVYIDDIVVKSKTKEQHLVNLRQLFGIPFHQMGVEVDKNKARAMVETPPSTNKVQLQRLLGKINFLRRFIANLAGKIRLLTHLLRLKDKEEFEWGPSHQKAFDRIKAYLDYPLVLIPPQRGKPLKLYIVASKKSMGSMLAQNNEGGKEHAICYLSKILIEVETRYTSVEQLCLALYLTACKLRHYMLPCHTPIIAKIDVIKYMLSKPMLIGRIGKWILALSELSFQHVPQRAIKGQAIADFFVEHQESQEEIIKKLSTSQELWSFWITPGKLYFDGSCTQNVARARIVIIDPKENKALIIGLEILIELGVTGVEVFGDSKLVINQLNGEYKCRHVTMAGYHLAATQLLSYWGTKISVSYILRESNIIANEMAQLASGVPIQEKNFEGNIEVHKRNLPSIFEKGFSLDVMTEEMKMEDWRTPIIQYLNNPSFPTSKKNRRQETKYVIWDKTMLRKTLDGLLLKWLGQEESMRVMAEVHEGICGAHQARNKMRWLLRRYGYFWPEMEMGCKAYAQGCEE
ncbi:unnamed protein product [Malus baccata var. baccata]